MFFPFLLILYVIQYIIEIVIESNSGCQVNKMVEYRQDILAYLVKKGVNVLSKVIHILQLGTSRFSAIFIQLINQYSRKIVHHTYFLSRVRYTTYLFIVIVNQLHIISCLDKCLIYIQFFYIFPIWRTNIRYLSDILGKLVKISLGSKYLLHI